MTPLVRMYVLQLQEDSKQLFQLAHFSDAGEAVGAVTRLSTVALRGLASDHTREAPDGREQVEEVADVIQRLGAAVSYVKRCLPFHVPVL